ncbi:MAG: ribonuclease PH [Spirochaetes bacterium]|nr:ribonuclease PH [Spirochaetota bacterium]
MYKRTTRKFSEARKITFEKNIMKNAYSSVAVSYGDTKVFCTASIDHKVPPFAEDMNSGWLTAEYNMLPASTDRRKPRNIIKPDGRNVEIQRLIGRALRAAVNLKRFPGITIMIDCDVIQADGGTRTASISGGFLALKLAVDRLLKEEIIKKNPIVHQIASISAGKVHGQIMVDLDFMEDKNAEVDFNVIMTDSGDYVEIQGTAEKGIMTRENFDIILKYCEQGINHIFKQMEEVYSEI